MQAQAVRLAARTPFSYDDILAAMDVIIRAGCSIVAATRVVEGCGGDWTSVEAFARTIVQNAKQWRRASNR